MKDGKRKKNRKDKRIKQKDESDLERKMVNQDKRVKYKDERSKTREESQEKKNSRGCTYNP